VLSLCDCCWLSERHQNFFYDENGDRDERLKNAHYGLNYCCNDLNHLRDWLQDAIDNVSNGLDNFPGGFCGGDDRVKKRELAFFNLKLIAVALSRRYDPVVDIFDSVGQVCKRKVSLR
jgi:hypothetical protein